MIIHNQKMSNKTILKSLKLATAFAGCWIFFQGDVLGGPLWVFVLVGLISKYWEAIVQSVAFILVICLYIESAFNPSRKWDLLLFTISGVVFDFLVLRFQGFDYTRSYFLYTFGIYNALWISTIYSIQKFNINE